MRSKKKILILRMSSLGDIVLTEPIVRNIRSLYPNAVIDYLTKPVFAPIIRAFESVNNIYFWNDKISLILSLRKQKYDLIIDLHDKLNTFLIKAFVPAKNKITYNKKHLLRRKIVSKKTDKKIDSTLDLYATIFPKIKKEFVKHIPQLHPEKKYLRKVKDEFLQIKIPLKQLIGVFPGATHATKCFPKEKFVEIINSFPERHFILFGSNKEMEICNYIEQHSETKIHNFVGKFNIGELINAVDLLEIVISNDSGPMHLAAALQKKQITFFGATHTDLGMEVINVLKTILIV